MPRLDATTHMDSNYAHCENLLRELNRTAWLAAMFAPQALRHHLHALHAFAHELQRVPLIVSEPALGEIRLQWWREVVDGDRTGEAAANPVSAALLETMAVCGLPKAALAGMIEARRFDLYADPMPALNDLEGYCGETQSALFRLAAIALCDGEEPGAADACGHAGVALGIVRILQDLPFHAARGRCYVPKDILARNGALVEAVAAGVVSEPLLNALRELRGHARGNLAAAKAGMAQMDKRAHPALVSLATVDPLLRIMDKRKYEPFDMLVELPQWRVQWAMWRW